MNEPAVPREPQPPVAGAARAPFDARTAGLAATFAGVAAIALAVSSVTLLILMLALSITAAGELYRVVLRGGGSPVPLAGFAAIAALFALAYDGADTLLAGAPAVAAAVAGVSLVVYVLRGRIEGALSGVAATTGIALAIGVLGSFVIALRRSEGGFRITLAFALMIAAGDAAASLAGRRFGSRALAPSVGPDKTWEGLAGGTAGVFAAAIIAGAVMGEPVTMSNAILLGTLVAVAAPLGDLASTMITRDSPRPRMDVFGRGGIIDRVDALLFAAPIFYFAYRAMVR